jgi:hypothetical protein
LSWLDQLTVWQLFLRTTTDLSYQAGWSEEVGV